MRLERFTADNGKEICVQVDGHDPAIVLLHEWAIEPSRLGADHASAFAQFYGHRRDARGHYANTPRRVRPPPAGRSPSSAWRTPAQRNLLDHLSPGTSDRRRPLGASGTMSRLQCGLAISAGRAQAAAWLLGVDRKPLQRPQTRLEKLGDKKIDIRKDGTRATTQGNFTPA